MRRRLLLGCVALVTACSAAPAPTATAPSSPVATGRAHGDGASGGAATSPLLRPARGGDGDSWKDTQGREYRLGLVNTPELSECYGSAARSERQRLVAAGFRARIYMTDRYGRRVADVTLADGRDLNVLLARTGFADDRYLAQFRAEEPELARRLDVAFAAARRERAGLWGACR